MATTTPANASDNYKNEIRNIVQSNTLLTVGVTGKFATIQAAIDFIELADDCFQEVVGSHLEYFDIGGGTFVGIAVSDWAQDSNVMTFIRGTTGGTGFDKFSSSYWFGIVGEPNLYRCMSNSNNDSMFVDENRIGASIAGAILQFKLYTEKQYTIDLIDSFYNEEILISKPLSIKFVSSTGALWVRDDVNGSAVTRADGFTHGRLEFSDGLTLANTQYGFIQGGTSISGWDSIDDPSKKNNIRFAFTGTLRINNEGTDFFSPNVGCGSVHFKGVNVQQASKAGVGHLFVFVARGTIEADDISWNTSGQKFGVSGGDLLFFDSCQCRRLISNNIHINIGTLDDKVFKLAFIAGGKFIPEIAISKITVNTDAALSNLTVDGLSLIAMSTAINDAGRVIQAQPKITITSCAVNAQNATPADLFLFQGLAGQASNVSIADSHGAKAFNAGSDVITFVPQTTAETV